MRTVIAMGATPAMVRNVFLYEGLLIVLVGTVAGVLLGLAVCVAQQRFGFVELTGSVVEAYPVKVFASDLILVFATVSALGLMAAWVPLRSLSKRFLHATAASA
jgi:lipoprotein-releasing system permease protein